MLVLFVFAWLAALTASLLRPGPTDSLANFGLLRSVGSTLANGFEIFVFGYILSRFFKQLKTGCAFVITCFSHISSGPEGIHSLHRPQILRDLWAMQAVAAEFPGCAEKFYCRCFLERRV